MGLPLAQARAWAAERADLSGADRDFIERSAHRESKARARVQRLRALAYVLLVGIIAGLVGWINQSSLKEQINWFTIMRPYRVANFDLHVLTPAAERALKRGDAFRECATHCPEMVVVPAGEFMM